MKNQNSIARKVVDAIRSVVGSDSVALHEPNFKGNEWLYLKECLDSTFVSSVGKFVDQFESELAKYTGSKYAVAVVNGTAALHIALKVAGVRTGDEVLIPALTFVATANAVTYCNAIPHFVESERKTLGIDAVKLREYLLIQTEQKEGRCVNKDTGRILRAIVPMHTLGHPSDIDSLISIGHDFNIIIVEDAAESLGSFYKGKHTGTLGALGTLSFNGNKTITTGGGGAILTNNESFAKYAKHLSTTAKIPHLWEFCHDEIGYNYRLPNLNAAIGCAQLEQLPGKLASKRKLHSLYKKAFKDIKGVELMSEPRECQSNYWLQTLILDEENSTNRDSILQVTNDEGIMTRPVWNLLKELKPYNDCPSMNLDQAYSLFNCLINIPSSPNLIET